MYYGYNFYQIPILDKPTIATQNYQLASTHVYHETAGNSSFNRVAYMSNTTNRLYDMYDASWTVKCAFHGSGNAFEKLFKTFNFFVKNLIQIWVTFLVIFISKILCLLLTCAKLLRSSSSRTRSKIVRYISISVPWNVRGMGYTHELLASRHDNER